MALQFDDAAVGGVQSLVAVAGQLDAFTTKDEPVGIFLSDGGYYIDIFEDVSDYDVLFDQVRGKLTADQVLIQP